MTRCIPEDFSTWLVDWSLVTGNTMPPRDPDDDDDEVGVVESRDGMQGGFAAHQRQWSSRRAAFPQGQRESNSQQAHRLPAFNRR